MSNMKLPEGKTCADCCYENRCTKMFGAKPENTECDFSPSRFIATDDNSVVSMTEAAQ